MIKLITLALLVVCAGADEKDNEGGRQKRLLFFDESGSLVKTYPNPYLNNLSLKAENLPLYGKLLHPFFNFIKTFSDSLAAFAIPVSNAIVQQIKKDPNFQNSLVVIPKNPIVEPNTLCQGQRTQIPSPNLCNNFLNCWDGWAFEQECPNGLLFSNEGYCDYAGNVDCHNRKLDYDKLQPQPICSKDFEAFRNKDNCNEFFVCVNRQPIKFKCPADLAYSQYLGVCDYADRVNCQSNDGPILAPIPQPPNPAPIPITIPPASSDSAGSPSAPIPSPLAPIPSPSAPIPSPSAPSPSAPSPSDPLASSSMVTSLPSAPPPTDSIASIFPPIPSLPPQPAAPTGRPSFPFLPQASSQPSEASALEIRPVIDVYQPPSKVLKETDEKPALPLSIFAKGCASNIAMSRQDAIRQLQAQTSN